MLRSTSSSSTCSSFIAAKALLEMQPMKNLSLWPRRFASHSNYYDKYTKSTPSSGVSVNLYQKFIIPLAVGKGHCNFMVQHHLTGTTGCAVFSTLDDFQRFGEAAPVRLAAQGFSDLLEERQLGLVRAKFDGGLITREQALELVHSCVDLYTTGSYSWIQRFNHDPDSFNYNTFLDHFKQRFSTRSDFVHLTTEPINVSQIQHDLFIRSDAGQFGAIATFCGMVRELDERQGKEERIQGIDYETCAELFVGETRRLLSEVRLHLEGRIGSVSIVHRVDTVFVGEVTSVVVVTSKHRKDALLAIDKITEGMKERVPLWKKVIKGDGSQRLVSTSTA
ncbi:hypothetical protein PSACC_03096 [Paramicrosporidium saccamoebae]|uniref:Uncharacterized protein n=1 Tax=Paramicrosporidium saccamoebae TaxID=1246581 RepID=A0A2H9TH71_9FUNG|nr:hypothetical protein PSACC_03096 [Paramicrosporidium saccamoebae]